MTLKKQLLAGFITGAVLITGGLLSVHAAPKADADQSQKSQQIQSQQKDHRGGKINREFSRENVAKKIAARYGVSEAEIQSAFDNHVHPHDIDRAALLAKISGKSFSEVLAMKSDWRDVEKKLGITGDQVRDAEMQLFITDLAEDTGASEKTIKSLLDEGYDPHDIEIAGYLAKESKKDIKKVLGMRKINNHWSDVADELGVKAPERPDRLDIEDESED